jgi:hypothetical protein
MFILVIVVDLDMEFHLFCFQRNEQDFLNMVVLNEFTCDVQEMYLFTRKHDETWGWQPRKMDQTLRVLVLVCLNHRNWI